jgi:hypothetical protein
MATLQEKLDEMARIRTDLQKMENDESVTEEDGGDMRDTLVARWEQLDAESKPLIARMEKVKGITRAAEDPANREAGSDGGNSSGQWGSRGPELMTRRDPFENIDHIRRGMITREDAVARASTAIENHDRRMLLPHGRGEAATRSAQNPAIARHILMHGNDEYFDAFRAYVEDPTGPGLQRAAGALSLANAQGGFHLVAAA